MNDTLYGQNIRLATLNLCVVLLNSYCLPNFSPDKKKILWTCEECLPPKADKIMNSRRSERITCREDKAFEARRTWRKRLNQNRISVSEKTAKLENKISKAAVETDGHPLYEETKREQSSGETLKNQEPIYQRKLILEDEGDSHEQVDYELTENQNLKKRRRLILQDEGDCDEQLDSIEVKSSLLAPSTHCQSNTSHSQSSLEYDDYNNFAEPLTDSIWR